MIERIRELATLLPSDLYLVGGYVRDSLSGFAPHDYDVCADIDPQVVIAALAGTKFKVSATSPKLFTLKISCDRGFCEYTAFRVDSYSDFHRPDSAKRTSNIRADALRRDFRANAIYLNPLTGEYVDPLNGISDVKNRILKMTREETFCEDGLRLMRLCRQAAESGFSVEKKTLAAAKKNVGMLKFISPERIRDELDRILVADARYGIKDAHIKGLQLLDEISALDIILPELTLGKGMPQRADFHKFDVFGHIIETVKYADPKVRLAALLHDIGKPYCYKNFGNYHGHDVEGARIAEEILSRLRYSNATIKETKALIYAHMFDLNGDAKENAVRKFILKNREYFDKILLLKQADFTGSGILSGECPTNIKLKKIYADMMENSTPFSLSELKVNGDDAKDVGLAGKEISEALNALLQECAMKDSPLRDRESQLRFLTRYKKNGG